MRRAGRENQAFTLADRVTDGRRETAHGRSAIDVDDEMPTVSANATVQLDDDALTGGMAAPTRWSATR